jgi:RNA polymerase sigma factor (sigma-70 family)
MPRNTVSTITKLSLEYKQAPEDTAVRDALILAYRPLVGKIAAKYARTTADQDELFGAGVIGLLEALPKWDPDKGTLGTYATKAILGRVQDEAFRLYGHAVGVPERAPVRTRRSARRTPRGSG